MIATVEVRRKTKCGRCECVQFKKTILIQFRHAQTSQSLCIKCACRLIEEAYNISCINQMVGRNK